jgi:hypothetical protein
MFFVFLFSPKEEAVKADRRSDAHEREAEKCESPLEQGGNKVTG